MAARLPSPFPHWVNSAGAPYAGGFLYFYLSGTDTPLDSYSDATLSTLNTNPVVLNSAGRPSVAIFLKNQLYKVVLKDSAGNEIWTADPVSATDFASVIVTKVGSGSPTGVQEGTAGSANVLPTMYWDFLNLILYVCSTTGPAASAVWTALNASAPTPTVTPPQGYLTPTSATPIILATVSAATSVYYTPFVGNLVPIYNGSRMIPTEFSELTLALVSQHALSTLYDVFVFNNGGVPTLVTGPAWSSSTLGSCSRGSGAGTTQLTRLNGYWVNAVSMTGRNGSTTYTIGASLATYVGSLFIDGTAGQVTCHRGFGQSRKWGIWNAYNRQPIYLRAGDTTANWTYQTNTIRAANGSSNNSLTTFQGLAEEIYDFECVQKVAAGPVSSDATVSGNNGIGFNSTTAMSGQRGRVGLTASSSEDTGVVVEGTAVARLSQAPSLGIDRVTALETAENTNGTMTWYGGEDDMVLSAKWRG